ncbi:MAG: O-antigen ligase family protein, partial [bacterium]|nr:O-antigen ligase family protein [bacterium]
LIQALIGWSREVELEAILFGLILNLRYLVFMVLLWIITKETDLIHRLWQKILLIPAAIVVSFGLLQQFLLPKDFLTHFGYGVDTIPATHTVDEKENLMRLQSTLRGPNPLGAYLVLIITTVFNRLLLAGKNYKASILGASALSVLFFSYSRSGLVGLVISIFVLLNIKFPHLRAKILITSGLFLILSLGGLMMFRDVDQFQNIAYHADENSTSSSNQVRLDSISNNAKDVIKHPFGGGVGSAGPASQRTDNPKIAENYYIQIAQEVGIIGLLIYLLVSAMVISGLWFRRQDQLALILIASFAGLTFINLISHAWTDDTISLIWWGLAGVALAMPVKKRTN